MPASDKIDLNKIAKIFGLPAQEEIDELNWEGVADAGHYAEEEAEKEGLSAKKVEKAREEAEMEAQDEIYHQYHNALTSVADQIFEAHGLRLVPVRQGERYPFEYRVQPDGGGWAAAAQKIVNTISGVGMFGIPREDYVRSPRTFVLSHLHHVRDYPEVYGTASAKRIYEGAWR
jgi:hypothetical protein